MAISLVGSTTAASATTETSHSVTLPSGISTGDLVELYCVSLDATVTFNTPTGYTATQATFAGGSTTAGLIGAAFRKVSTDGAADSGSSVSVSITGATGRKLSLVAAAWHGVDRVTPIDAGPSTPATHTASPGTSAAVTTTVADAFFIAWVGLTQNTNNTTPTATTPPTGMTALNNTGTAIASIGNTAVYVAYQDIAAAGSTGTKSWATASFSRGITFSHALRPEISNLPRLGVARTRT